MAVNVCGALLVCSVLEWGLLRMWTLSFPHWAGSIRLGRYAMGRSASRCTVGEIDRWDYFLTPENATTLA